MIHEGLVELVDARAAKAMGEILAFVDERIRPGDPATADALRRVVLTQLNDLRAITDGILEAVTDALPDGIVFNELAFAGPAANWADAVDRRRNRGQSSPVPG